MQVRRAIPDSSKFVIADHNGRDPAPGPTGGLARSTGAGKAFPDQFQRDRTVVLDYTSDDSAWTQLAEASDRRDRFEGINAGGPQPVLKAYRVREEDLA